MKLKHQRLVLISSTLFVLGLAAFLILTALQDTLVFYYSPSDLAQKSITPLQRIRVGGLVRDQSLKKQGEDVSFDITDAAETVHISYQGFLPDLFREGQGVVVEGHLLSPGEFQAETVLVKHDENYMPKEVVDQLKKQGRWRDGA